MAQWVCALEDLLNGNDEWLNYSMAQCGNVLMGRVPWRIGFVLNCAMA
jgi:hypothetical protein